MWGMRVLVLGYEGISSGVCGYKFRGLVPGYVLVPGYEGISSGVWVRG